MRGRAQVSVSAGRPSVSSPWTDALGHVLNGAAMPDSRLPGAFLPRTLAALLAGLLLPACAEPSTAARPAPTGGVPSAVPSDGPTPTPTPPEARRAAVGDASGGYSVVPPATWVEVTSAARPDARFFASRPGITSLRDLAAGDSWLVVRRDEPHPLLGCGAPVGPTTTTTLSADPRWTVYVRAGVPDLGEAIADALTVVDGWCDVIQLVDGPGSDPSATGRHVREIALSFQRVGEPAAAPIPPPGGHVLTAAPDAVAPGGGVLVTGAGAAGAPLLFDSRPRCISLVGPPFNVPATGRLSVEVTMGSVFSGAGCPAGPVQVIVWIDYVPWTAEVRIGAG